MLPRQKRFYKSFSKLQQRRSKIERDAIRAAMKGIEALAGAEAKRAEALHHMGRALALFLKRKMTR